MEPLISVIVPIYKVESYLTRCLDSIVGQTYRNLEIILVDDGSPDNCGAICDRYAEKDSRILVIHQQNAGVSAARNAGLDIMTGEYVTFVDPDDWLATEAVQVLYERLECDGSDIAVGRHTDIYEDGRENDRFCCWMRDDVITSEDVLRDMGTTRQFVVASWGKLYRRELLEGIRYPVLTVGEDCWVYPDIIEKCKHISVVDQLIYFYYQRADSAYHVYDSNGQRDSLEANLKLVKVLYQREYMDAARSWYGRSIHLASRCRDRELRLKMIHSFFTKEEQCILLKQQGWKTRIKWAALHHPVIDIILTFLRRVKRTFFRQ